MYHRVLLKLSGESLGRSSDGHGIDAERVQVLARQIARVMELGVEMALVCGGGNILRGAEFSRLGGHRATADYMGMLGTVINALALSEAIGGLLESRELGSTGRSKGPASYAQ